MSFIPQVGVQAHTASHHSWSVLEWLRRSSAVLLHEGVGTEAWAGHHALCNSLSCRRWGACSAVSWSRHHTNGLSRGTVEVSIRVGECLFFSPFNSIFEVLYINGGNAQTNSCHFFPLQNQTFWTAMKEGGVILGEPRRKFIWVATSLFLVLLFRNVAFVCKYKYNHIQTVYLSWLQMGP